LVRIDGKLVPSSWDDAIAHAASKLKQYKPDEIGLVTSPFLTNETAFLLEKFAATVLSTNNIESTTDRFVNPVIKTFSESGLLDSKNSIRHLEKSKWIMILGNRLLTPPNALIPSILKAKKNGAKVIQISKETKAPSYVVDSSIDYGPSETLNLFYEILEKLTSSISKSSEFENFDEFSDSLKKTSSSKLKDVSVDELLNAVSSGSGSIIFDQDSLNCSNCEELAKAIVNLLILTQSTEGAVPYLGAGNALGVEIISQKYKSSLENKSSDKNSKNNGEMLEGGVKALYLTESIPQSQLKDVEFLILQDIYGGELLDKADVVFPACAFTEEEGTVNTIGGKQKINQAVSAPGSAQPDWKIICDLAKKMGDKGFEFKNTGDVSSEIENKLFTKKSNQVKLLLFSQKEVKDLPSLKPRYWYRGSDLIERVEDFRIQITGGESK